jgi:hypothetical protein
MPMTHKQKENIDQMNKNLGGGIISDKSRIKPRNNPMLVIGLGGTGIDALIRVKYFINKRFVLPVGENGRKKEAPDNIKYIALETDLDAIQNKEYYGIRPDITKEYQDISAVTINTILDNPQRMPSYITDWLDDDHVKLKSVIKGGTKGASGVRQGGRLMLFLKIEKIVNFITATIRNLLKDTNQNQRLEVFILTGVSGGTGSGTFIDIPYIIRGLMEQGDIVSSGGDRIDIMGYIFTPDVLIAKEEVDNAYYNVIYINGFTALKELDYLMNIVERNGRFKQKYGDLLTVNVSKPPYDMCHLISAMGEDGKIPPKAYDYCMNVAAENIVNFMASMTMDTGNEFSVHAYISNVESTILQLTTPKYSANYVYYILGASAVELPQEDIMTYLAARLFIKMRELFNSSPSQGDVDSYTEKMGLTIREIESIFDKNVTPPLKNCEKRPQYSVEALLRSVQIIDDDIKDWYEATITEYDKVYRNLGPVIIKKIEDDFIKRIFTDKDKGPFYAQRLLFSFESFNITNSIKAFQSAIERKQGEYSGKLKNISYMEEESLNIFKKAILKKDRKRLDYIDYRRQEARLTAEVRRTEFIKLFYDNLYNGLMDLNNRTYDTFVKLLEYLVDVFEKNANIITTIQRTNIDGINTYHWNLFNVSDVKIKNVLDKALDNINIDKCIHDITTEMLKQSGKWIKDDEIDIASFISDFVTEQFDKFAEKTMEDYLIILSNEDEDDAMRIIEKDILPKLSANALPLFPVSADGKTHNTSSWRAVVVPKNCPSIYKVISAACKTGANEYIGTKVWKSGINYRIFWLNMKVGIPMYFHSGMEVYEDRYENAIKKRLDAGLHLYQSKSKDWRDLPSPIPEGSWSSAYVNNRIKDKNKKLRELFNKAYDYGIIQINDNRCWVNIAKDIKISSISEIMISANDRNRLYQIFTKLNSYKEMWKNVDQEYKRYVFVSSIEDADEKTQFTENFLRCYDLWGITDNEVKTMDMINSKIDECQKAIDDIKNREIYLKEFADALYTGTIKHERNKFKYDNDINEEAWDLLVTTSLKRTDDMRFVEYSAFKEFIGLDKRKRSLISRKSENRAENADSKTIASAREFYEKFKKIKFDIDQGIAEVTDESIKDDISDFYFKMVNIYDLLCGIIEAK